MKLFRILVIVIAMAVYTYTIYTGLHNGWNLFSVFFEDILNVTWRGQFNIDFLSYLLLTALWTSWRQKFSSLGIVLGMLAFVGGIMFLAPYILHLIYKNDANVHRILLGKNITNESLK
ncbi:hypothetical protein [uncultured Kordia sp.]|uniref:hypothetical protein n=1 Tax=uncultured Kordia sp. TaxID=507699 RepID=UPI002611D509|nr:hypothetical protein [uncultured Kordia sp.]